MTPAVSVVLPFRNAVSTLSAAVQSICMQTLDDWELLLFDDGSSDGSEYLAAEWRERDSRIQVLQGEGKGLVHALNAGLSAARGDVIARMDADDISLPNRLERQHEFLEKHPEVGVTACGVAFGGDREACPGYALHVDWVNGLVTPAELFANRFVESPLAHPSVMWRREVSDRLGAYREGPFPEDYDLWLRWMNAGVTFRKDSEPGLIWKDPPSRLSRTDPRYSPDAFYRLKCEYLAPVLPLDRPCWLWGSGRVTRRRFTALESHTRPFAGFVDIDPAKIGRILHDRPIVSPDGIPADAFVLVGVGSRGARDQIKDQLESSGRKAVRDFLLCA